MLGGITTGRPLVANVSFKPTSTITTAQESVRKDLSEIEYQLKKGRHDPCVAVRAGVALESRMAIELANAVLHRQAGCVHKEDFDLFG
jgi:chorismate synthase